MRSGEPLPMRPSPRPARLLGDRLVRSSRLNVVQTKFRGVTIGRMAFAAHVPENIALVWCRRCLRRFEPDTTDLANEHDRSTRVLAWAKRLRCTECGERDADFVVTGEGANAVNSPTELLQA